MPKEKEPEKPDSGTYRTRKDGTKQKKKAFWLNAEVARELEWWAVYREKEENEVVDQILRDYLKRMKVGEAMKAAEKVIKTT
jgi:hypothetical protein